MYVDIVKAASEAIRSTLEDRFHASWSADLGGGLYKLKSARDP